MTINASRSLQKILIIDAGLPSPSRDAGSQAILDFIRLIRATDSSGHCSLHFLAMGHHPFGEVQGLQSLNVVVHQADESLQSATGQTLWLDRLSPDLVVVSRPGPASQWLSSVMQIQKRPKLSRPLFFYYGHDIHYERLSQQQAFDQEILGQQINLHRVLEPMIWKQFDQTIYGSAAECKTVDQRFPGRAIHLPLYEAQVIHQVAANEWSGSPKRPTVLWVGGAHHAPNRDAIRWLLQEILPKVDLPMNLHLVGDWPQALRDTPEFQWVPGPQHRLREDHQQSDHQVLWRGVVSSAELHQSFRECAFAIAPLRFGAGVKGKVFQAINHQCPVLTTPVGAQGLEHLSWPEGFVVAPKTDALVAALRLFLQTPVRQQMALKLRQMHEQIIRDTEAARQTWARAIQKNLAEI